MRTAQSTDSGARKRFSILNCWQWKLACVAVVGITYVAVYCALNMPKGHLGANFFFTAFPAGLVQFYVIDLTRNGFKRS